MKFRFSSKGSGIQTFENTTADFGTVDGSYTTTRAISEKELEVTIPFKIPPTVKQFDSAAAIDTTNDVINITNHFYSTGTRVIYNNAGNSDIGGIVHNTDYYAVLVDNNHFKLAPTLQDALDGTNLLTFSSTSSGLHEFISGNLSGEVTGTGTIEVNLVLEGLLVQTQRSRDSLRSVISSRLLIQLLVVQVFLRKDELLLLLTTIYYSLIRHSVSHNLVQTI